MARIPGLPGHGAATVGRPPRRVRALQSDHLCERTTVSRLVTLLATGLERWIMKQSAQGKDVDFVADQSVTTPHPDNVNEELPWH